MNGLRDYYIKWSKSEKDKYHTISLIHGIKKMTNEIANRNRHIDMDMENKHMVTKGMREGIN